MAVTIAGPTVQSGERKQVLGIVMVKNHNDKRPPLVIAKMCSRKCLTKTLTILRSVPV